MGKVSQGQGASIAGVSKRVFIESLGNYGVSVFNYPAEDLEMEFKAMGI
jgi:predicted HTH domain antitoxin